MQIKNVTVSDTEKFEIIGGTQPTVNVGGTNADFFNINGNGQMLNTAMENGELINPDPNYSNPWWRGILGFTKDNELITGIPSVTNYYNLHVYTEKTMKN